jgi:hypothetical protein
VYRPNGDKADQLPDLMNTFRMEPRWARVGRGRTPADLRALIIAVSLLVLFGAAFAIGRATSSASTPHAEAQAGVTAVPAGSAVPIRLSAAPPLPVAAVAPPPVRTPQRSRPARTRRH